MARIKENSRQLLDFTQQKFALDSGDARLYLRCNVLFVMVERECVLQCMRGTGAFRGRLCGERRSLALHEAGTGPE
jgi:hypothetical protein